MSSLQARIFTIPPDRPFLRLIAETLCDGRLAPGFRYDPADPLSLSKVTILVPTRRAVRVLRAQFVEVLGGQSAILPMIKPLGEAEDDASYFDAETPALLALNPPISNTVRLLELAQLILAWRNKLPDIVLSIHTETPLVAPASPADAVWLARALVELIDSVETEERDWADLDKLDARDFASWWQLTLAFLGIASAYWPARLEELNRSSPVLHRNALLRTERDRVGQLSDPHPVIVAGSTGSIPAASELIAAVARLPQGVIVLPGLDKAMPDDQWQSVGGEQPPGMPPEPTARTHPQYGLHRLLGRLGLTRDDVGVLEEGEPELADRSEILSRALSPAKATDQWTAWRQAFGDNRFEAAFADVALIEAANEREEAIAIALALRLALERPGADGGESRAALITPDRNLARRVASELARFGIEADDSAGTPFSATPQGTLLVLVLEAVLRPGDPVAIVSLLKHPLARFGLTDDGHRDAADALEAIALRGGTGAIDIAALAPLFDEQVITQFDDRHPPAWRRSFTEQVRQQARILAEAIAEAVEPLAGHVVAKPDGHHFTTRLSLREWAERTGQVLEAVARTDEGDLAPLWANEAGAVLARLLSEIMETDGQLSADGPQWIEIVAALTASESVKPKSLRHPRVFIFGALESRLQNVDTMILGGLNEGSWPGTTTNNPFLSRSMKTEMGLEPPERQIGQLAHDFEMANGTRHLIYCRALRQGSAPTVASRWLQRLLALGGKDFAEALKARGERYRHFAELLDKGADQAPAQRPQPKPPADLHPKTYSFSEVGRLRRDPYSIYARRILKLDPVEPFNSDPGASERGTLYHAIVEQFVARMPEKLGPDAEQLMSEIADTLFAEENLPPHIHVVWRKRFAEVGLAFIDWQRQRDPAKLVTEARAGVELGEIDIRLTGIADRIDIRAGHADIIDYKTGLNPSVSQARSLLDPQLALEAAALTMGAFKDVGRLNPDNLIYVRLRPGGRFKADQVNNELTGKGDKAKSALDLAQESIAQLTRFVTLLQSGERGYVSRLMPAMMNDFSGDYDHLARVAEWSTAEAAEESGGDE
ncbi:double-strand break repair protein AddB [Agrobacterium vitis]|uniref:double-strand break repair protein AddB n=1 Tax=Agrobacterium vitis TaxID=373 RepID=UPI0015D9B5CC|nr:double-strand break repair protein AddB [Agrobacterium vitis]MCF1454067.1 double-strand break repair protein AddB [Agrobacterium vitis]BCH52813.1 double-strand break repair protein AddB [Agrobacterium vitis]